METEVGNHQRPNQKRTCRSEVGNDGQTKNEPAESSADCSYGPPERHSCPSAPSPGYDQVHGVKNWFSNVHGGVRVEGCEALLAPCSQVWPSTCSGHAYEDYNSSVTTVSSWRLVRVLTILGRHHTGWDYEAKHATSDLPPQSRFASGDFYSTHRRGCTQLVTSPGHKPPPMET